MYGFHLYDVKEVVGGPEMKLEGLEVLHALQHLAPRHVVVLAVRT